MLVQVNSHSFSVLGLILITEAEIENAVVKSTDQFWLDLK